MDLNALFALAEHLGRDPEAARAIQKAAKQSGRTFIEREAHWRRTKLGEPVWVRATEVHLHPHEPNPPRNANQSVWMGHQAIHRVLAAKTDFIHAMHRKNVGWIDVQWGIPGDGAPEFKGGFGIDHIMTKRDWQHGQDVAAGKKNPRPDGITTLRHLPEVIAKGTITRVDGNHLRLEFNGWVAAIVKIPATKENPGSGWLLSGFEHSAGR